MKEIKTTIYKCDHCGKIYQRKFYCNKHEKICRKNPANDRPCFNCSCLTMKTIEYGDYDPEDGVYPSRGNALYCKKQDQFVYPPYTKKPYYEDDDPDMNIAMPLICSLKE